MYFRKESRVSLLLGNRQGESREVKRRFRSVSLRSAYAQGVRFVIFRVFWVVFVKVVSFFLLGGQQREGREQFREKEVEKVVRFRVFRSAFFSQRFRLVFMFVVWVGRNVVVVQGRVVVLVFAAIESVTLLYQVRLSQITRIILFF